MKNDPLSKLHKNIRRQEQNLALLIGSRKFIHLPLLYEYMGNLDAVAKYCHVSKSFLNSRIDVDKGRVYEPIAGCISAGFNNIRLYIEGDHGQPIQFGKIK